eukprot:scaffold80790_cov42-Phaeocystis_antarctica.AAC.2
MEVPWQPNSSSPSTGAGAPPEGRLPDGESLGAGEALPRVPGRQSPAPPPPPPPPPPPLALAEEEAQEEAQMTQVAQVAEPPCWMPGPLGVAPRAPSAPPSAAADGAPSAAAPSVADGSPSADDMASMAVAAASAFALLTRSVAGTPAVAAAGVAADGMRGGRLIEGGVAPPFWPLRSACLAAVAFTAACQDEVFRVAEALL